MKYLLIILLPLALQAQQPCPYFSQYLSRGDKEMQKGSKANFEAAINAYNNAMTHCPARAAEAWQKVLVVFREIDKLRKEAEEAKRRATQEKKEKEVALAKAQKLIDAFYFYHGKYALAYNAQQFYFMNKSGDEVEKLGRWDKAEQFDFRSGWAKVKNNTLDFLLDTLGNTYRVAYNIEDVDTTITALAIAGKKLSGDYAAASGKLKELIYAYLSNCNIDTLTLQISEWKNLKEISLSGNQLTSLPPQIGEWKNLKVIYLSGNQLTKLPPQISEWKNLKVIYLSDNQLTNLPTQINEWKKLQAIGLIGNKLTNLPPQVDEWKSVEEIYLSNNQLTSLPPQISEWKELQSIDLSNNQLTNLPSQISEWKELQSIDLSNNQLTNLPSQISVWNKLVYLNLRRNQLYALSPQLAQLKNLKYINLFGNPIPRSEVEKVRKWLPKCKVIF